MDRMRIFVGLSGGVDSALSAALLQREGHDVTGVFIRTWHPEGFPCSEGDDEREAMRVAAHLKIPFLVLDLAKRYEEDVAKHFIEGYAKGETPNPDILCNREVKFGGFLDFAMERGADKIATGHYAQIEMTDHGLGLFRGRDEDTDQSYFLSSLTKEQLEFILFPVGGMKKNEVRTLAQSFDLPNAIRKDSQGICFLGAIDLKAFLSKYMSLKSGSVLSSTGEAIGTHDGAQLYTVGQRHGFTVVKKQDSVEPLYVQETNIENNTIVVVPKDQLVGKSSVKLRDFNKLVSLEGKKLVAQIRYRGELVPADVIENEEGVEVHFSEPLLQAFGQTVALYFEDELVGAGVSTA